MKKFIGLALTVVMAFGMIGCGGGGNGGNGDNGNGTQEGGALPPIVMGTNAEFPPFEFLSATGEIIGIDVAIARAIAEEAGRELIIEDMDFDALLLALNAETVDFVIAGMTASGARGEERRQSVDFSIPYFWAMQALVVNEGSDISSVADAIDRRVAAVQGYSGYLYARDMNFSNLSAYRNPTDAIMALVQGGVEAVILDYTTAMFLAGIHGLTIVMDEDAFEEEYYAVAVRQGDTELLNLINRVIENLTDTGELGRIIEHYREYVLEN